MSVHRRTDHWGLVAGLIAGLGDTRHDDQNPSPSMGYRGIRSGLWKRAKSPRRSRGSPPLLKGGLNGYLVINDAAKRAGRHRRRGDPVLLWPVAVLEWLRAGRRGARAGFRVDVLSQCADAIDALHPPTVIIADTSV